MTNKTEACIAYQFALDPTPSQAAVLASHCGAAHFAYNTLLGEVKKHVDDGTDMSWSAFSLRKHYNQIKEEVAPWWREVSKEAHASGAFQLAAALKNWSDSKRGIRRGPDMGFPKFKSKHRTTPSVTFTTGVIRLEDTRHHITLPVVGRIHTLESTRRLYRLIENGQARLTRATVKMKRGRWMVSLLARINSAPSTHKHPGTVIGLDAGAQSFIVGATPDGAEVCRILVPPAILELEQAKRCLQRRARNKQVPDRKKGIKASKRWMKAQRRIAKIDWKIANIREDLLHKTTAELCQQYETVVTESLGVKGMMARGGSRKRGLNRAIGRAAMSKTAAFISYKSAREGGTHLQAHRFYPSSKTCSGCGLVKAKLSLWERVYLCDECGLRIDRDLNAAINLARLDMAGSTPVTGRGARCKTITLKSGAVRKEASTSAEESSMATSGCAGA